MEIKEMQEIAAEFKAKYPDYSGLNIRQMKQVLIGEMVIVDVQGRKKFVLMKKEDVAPGGKLDQMNAQTRQHNRKVRAAQRQAKADALRRFNLIKEGRYEEAFK